MPVGGTGGGLGAEAIAGAIQAMNAAGDDARTPREPKTVAEAYKETYRTLLKYGNVLGVEEVAPFLWERMDNSLKRERHIILTQELQKVCMSRGLSTEQNVPVITALLKQMVVSFQLTGHGADNLTADCQPFLVSYAGSASHYQSLEAASVSNQLSEGGQNASLADYRTIRENEKVRFPRDVSEVTIMLMRYAAVLCQCLFEGTGAPHPFVEAMWGALALNMQNVAPFVTERYQGLVSHPSIAATYCTRIICAVQLAVYK